jgi:hypothetical protein
VREVRVCVLERQSHTQEAVLQSEANRLSAAVAALHPESRAPLLVQFFVSLLLLRLLLLSLFNSF